jgi:iron(III) transport system permease protein
MMFGVAMSPGSAIILEATLRSLGIAVTAAGIAGVLGIVMAWLVSRTDTPGAKTLSHLLSVPYAIPPYLLGMAWVVLGNPAVGLLKSVLPRHGSYGFWGITLVEATVAFAFPYLELKAGFERMDPALEEAARMSGARPLQVFRDVSLPLLWPALLNGVCLAFLYTVSAFGVPALLGLPVRQFTLTTLIYSQLKLGGAAGIMAGFKLSLILLGIAALGLGLSAWLAHRRASRGEKAGALSGGKSSRPSVVKLGPLRIPSAFLTWGFFGVAVVLPWFALAISALAPVAGRYSPSLWTLKHLVYVLTLPDFQEALFNSFGLALTVASIIVGGGFLLGFAAIRRKKRWALWMTEALGIPFATPGTVLAMAVLFVAVLSARFGVPINEPLFMMAVAYGVKYAAVGARSMVMAFQQVDPVLEEAGRVSGASTRELLWDIWVPLLKKSIIAAWLLALLPILTELTMSVLLTGPGASTLGTVLFELQEYADQPSAAALAWMLLTLALAVGFATQFEWKLKKEIP